MKIFEVATVKLRLELVPAHVAIINGRAKINRSQFEKKGYYDCSDCNGTGSTRWGNSCKECRGAGKIWGVEPRGNFPSFKILATNFDYFKNILDIEVYDGTIPRHTGVPPQDYIQTIRNNILKFLDDDLLYLDQPEINQAVKPKVKIGKNRLTNIVPQRLYVPQKKKESVIDDLRKFDRFLGDVQKIENAGIMIKDA